jgi:predicted AlkP superfamily pyrophosphatase or phosphodiesterase
MSGVKIGLVGLLATSLMSLALPAISAAEPAPKPKLVIAISVDQFSANLYEDWRPRWTDGMKRLSAGVVYPAGYQSHAATETCPGHSTLLSGRHPNKTGIVANDLRDPATGKMVYCLYDPSKTPADGSKDAPVGPKQLMADTLGDWLKAASPQSRVVAVSSKDRGAINMAGHNPDAVFWMKFGFGLTTYVSQGGDAAKSLAPVATFNAKIAPMWTKRPTWTSAPGCKALEAEYQINGKPWKATVPPQGWGQSDDPKVIPGEVQYSPNADALTLQAAEHLLAQFKLGQGPATDLLAVSFSGTDYIGHRYGSRGPEMCDQLSQLDHLVGALMKDADKLGVPYVVVLSADHGGSDFAERLALMGYDAHREDGRAAFAEVKAAAAKALGVPAIKATGGLEEVYIDEKDPAKLAQISIAMKQALLARPEVAAAFTQGELLSTPIPKGKPADELTIQERFAESTYAGRSADVSAALQPYMNPRAAEPGSIMAAHGSVWNYDRRVPILFWWKGAPNQTRFLPIETVDIAPTLAKVMGLTPPADVDGRALPLE